MNTIKFSAGVSINKGNIRDNNEDNFYFNGFFLSEKERDSPISLEDVSNNDILVYAVFDGMGGEALGEEASLIAASTMKEYHNKIVLEKRNNIEKHVRAFINKTNERICKKVIDSGETRIGTTMASLFIENDTAKICNIGDSRVYMLRNGEITQISEDHTHVQRLINLGVISKKDAKNHKDRNKLTRYLGVLKKERTIEAYHAPSIQIYKGDKFLICSDGLTDMLDDEEIKHILKQKKSEEKICNDLVEKALQHGGNDNITAIVVCAKSKSLINKPGKNKNILTTLFVLFLVFGIIFVFLNTDKGIEYIHMENDENIKVTSITWATRISNIPIGKEGYVIASITPQDARSKINYKSSDDNVISVYEDGRYVAKSIGTAFLTAEADGVVSDKMEVVVYVDEEN